MEDLPVTPAKPGRGAGLVCSSVYAWCLVCGAVSGNLELLDFDCAGEAFAAWSELVAAHAPDLLDRLVIESSPSGGWHVFYRCEAPVCGIHTTQIAQILHQRWGAYLRLTHEGPFRPY
jgi:hypothetical protein